MPRHNCQCGSGLARIPMFDARHIFCFYYCDKCKGEKKSKFRPEIFTDPNYWADEAIEPDGDDW